MNQPPSLPVKYCHACGQTIDPRAEICPHCGVRQFYPQPQQQASPPNQQLGGLFSATPGFSKANEKRIIAGICGVLVGSLGIHKFILGYQNAGVTMASTTAICVVVSLISGMAPVPIGVTIVVGLLTTLVMSAVWVIGLVEGVLYLTKSDREFHKIYIKGHREWF